MTNLKKSVVSLLATVVAIGGCSETRRAPEWVAEQDTLGDTVVVRTIAGSVWPATARLAVQSEIGTAEGEEEYLFGRITGLAVGRDGSIYIYDSQVPAVRMYQRDGSYVRTFGRVGSGPGEYQRSDGGLAVLQDGRVVLRDPGNGRFQIWSAEGVPLATWPTAGGFSTLVPLVVDTAGFVFTSGVDFQRPPPRPPLLVKYSPEIGEPIDTIAVPLPEFRPSQVIAERNGGQTVQGIPFTPTRSWVFTPRGEFVFGVSTRYAIFVLQDSEVLRIEREAEAVAVQPAEKADFERAITENMRQMVPGWTWNGPRIPDVKPPFRSILTGEEGRIWVQRWQPGRRISEEDAQLTQWEEPIAYDVFERDGRYLGEVKAPRGFQPLQPRPVIRGDTVWAVIADSLAVQRVGRLLLTLMDTAEAQKE